MPRTCSVPGCRSNYSGEYVPVFLFPPEKERRDLWKKSINREDLKITKHTAVCISHFREDQISRELRIMRPDGSELVVPRKKLALESNAVPSVLLNVPNYLPKKPATSQQKVEIKTEVTEVEQEQPQEAFLDWLSEDKISSLEEIISNSHKFNLDEWIVRKIEKKVHFIKLDFSNSPRISKAMVIDDELRIRITFNNVRVKTESFISILGDNLICDTHSKLENLLLTLSSMEEHMSSTAEKIEEVQLLLGECIQENCNDHITSTLQFISEQLHQLLMVKEEPAPETKDRDQGRQLIMVGNIKKEV